MNREREREVVNFDDVFFMGAEKCSIEFHVCMCGFMFYRTTKRIEDGYKLCNDLITLIQERAEIEKSYASRLKGWSKKWAETIDKGPEYGTTEAAWKGILVEADRLYDLHSTIRDDLVNDVIAQIRDWQKTNFHKV